MKPICKTCENLLLDPREDLYHTQRFCALADSKLASYGHLLPKTSPRWCPIRQEAGKGGANGND